MKLARITGSLIAKYNSFFRRKRRELLNGVVGGIHTVGENKDLRTLHRTIQRSESDKL
jgi:hypothetical protein